MKINDSRFQFKSKIKKSDFESKLFGAFGQSRDISARRHTEEGKPMTLYYVDDGHAGTWMNGEGWIFTKEIVEKNIESTKAISQAHTSIDRKPR